jgi:hypothetical protein
MSINFSTAADAVAQNRMATLSENHPLPFRTEFWFAHLAGLGENSCALLSDL